MKVISILAFMVSGFFLFFLNMISFMNLESEDKTTTEIYIVVLVIFIISHLIGVLFFKKPSWKIPSSITILCAGLFKLFVLMIILLSPYIPSITAGVDRDLTEMYNNYALGIPTLLSTFILGVCFLISAKTNQ